LPPLYHLPPPHPTTFILALILLEMVLVSPLLRERLGVSSSFWMGELLFGSAHNLI